MRVNLKLSKMACVCAAVLAISTEAISAPNPITEQWVLDNIRYVNDLHHTYSAFVTPPGIVTPLPLSGFFAESINISSLHSTSPTSFSVPTPPKTYTYPAGPTYNAIDNTFTIHDAGSYSVTYGCTLLTDNTLGIATINSVKTRFYIITTGPDGNLNTEQTIYNLNIGEKRDSYYGATTIVQLPLSSIIAIKAEIINSDPSPLPSGFAASVSNCTLQIYQVR